MTVFLGENLPEMPLFLEPGESINLPLESSNREPTARSIPTHCQSPARSS